MADKPICISNAFGREGMLKQTIDIARFENTGAGFHEHLIELMCGHVLVRVLQQNGKDQHTI